MAESGYVRVQKIRSKDELIKDLVPLIRDNGRKQRESAKADPQLEKRKRIESIILGILVEEVSKKDLVDLAVDKDLRLMPYIIAIPSLVGQLPSEVFDWYVVESAEKRRRNFNLLHITGNEDVLAKLSGPFFDLLVDYSDGPDAVNLLNSKNARGRLSEKQKALLKSRKKNRKKYRGEEWIRQEINITLERPARSL